MRDFFVPLEMLLYGDHMEAPKDFVVRGFSTGQAEDAGTLTVSVSAASAPTLWTPAEITTALWLDASDSSTITLESLAVSQWADKSGNDRHATQITASARPTVASATLSGLDTLVFDGSNDFLSLGTQLGRPQNYTVFAVSKPTKALSNNMSVMCSIDPGGNSTQAWGSISNLSSQAGKLWWQYGSGSAYRWGFGAGAFTLGQWGLYCVRHENGTQDETAYKDGVLLTNSGQAGTATIVGGTAYEMAIGRMGAFQGYYFGGEVAEIVIMTSAASLADRQKIEGYLAHKWGMTASLPSDHPYKLAAPTI